MNTEKWPEFRVEEKHHNGHWYVMDLMTSLNEVEARERFQTYCDLNPKANIRLIGPAGRYILHQGELN